MSSTPEDRPPEKRQRRAAKACNFCRQRKLKCDNQRPLCANCRSYDQRCSYTTAPAPARPTKAKLAELQVENRRLRHALGLSVEEPESDRNKQSEAAVHPRTKSPSPANSSSSRNVRPQQSAVSRIFVSADGDSSYHGVTSTLFDDATTTDRPGLQVSADPKMPVEWVEKGLIAEAARQQQLETLNFHQGKLDFDGVDEDLGMHLLSLHWNRQHFSFLTTYRPAFMRDMACGGRYFSKLLLNAIYFAASKFSPRPEVRRDPDDVRTTGWIFRRRVKELLGDAMDRSEITTIQALLVMTSSLFALGDERSAAWLYAGIAFRMITDLGIHIDATRLSNMRHLSDEDLEIRRRVFWAAFVVDKIQSLYQGRPVSLQHLESQVPLTFLDKYEEMEYWKPFAYPNTKAYAGSPAFGVSTFTQLCKLSIILNGILNKVYSEQSANAASVELVEKLNSLHSELMAWYDTLPSHLRFEPGKGAAVPPPHVLSLIAMYNVLLILLHRPFVADGHLHSTNPSIAINSFSICASAASQIIGVVRAYGQTFSIRRAPYLVSYAVYVAATILVRIAAQRNGESEAHCGIRMCLSVFEENQETNWAVRRAKKVILHLMDRMGVRLNNSASEVDENPDSRKDIADNPNRDPEMVENPQRWRTTLTSPGTNTEPANGHETEDLNMRMIIQSFLREQNGQTSNGFMFGPGSGQYPMTPSPSNPGFIAPDIRSPAVSQYMQLANPTLAAADYPLQMAAHSFDDMLFGFNSASLDGIMWPDVTPPMATQ